MTNNNKYISIMKTSDKINKWLEKHGNAMMNIAMVIGFIGTVLEILSW